MENPNSRQIGGDHYRAVYQHWDFVADAWLGYFEAQITKYLSRWRKKEGVKDLAKALHYYEKLKELYNQNRFLRVRAERPRTHALYLNKYFECAAPSDEERKIFIALVFYRSVAELEEIPSLIEVLQERAKKELVNC